MKTNQKLYKSIDGLTLKQTDKLDEQLRKLDSKQKADLAKYLMDDLADGGPTFGDAFVNEVAESTKGSNAAEKLLKGLGDGTSE